MKKIAILGSTGYIGRSLAELFLKDDEFELFLFSRVKDESRNILPNGVFLDYRYDVILNSTGLGNPKSLRTGGIGVFEATESIDNLILKYLEKDTQAMVVHLSSGAVYNKIDVNNISNNDFYTIAKMNSEAKHRSLTNFNIIDLRIFSFFSHLVDTEIEFFMSDVVKSLKNKSVLETTRDDMIRDYVCPEDLYSLIKLVISKEKLNDFFDVYSKEPVSKFEVLDFFKNKYGLEYKIKDDESKNSPTGLKSEYFSKNKKTEVLGYAPKLTSLQGIEEEIRKMRIIS